ncbi:Hypothetical Protein FCC1311_024882 [Hondaea fermentalgiana]|uniref:EF-hand domain-containing protein n=1 Tax=Hondaea fermentalgiana TaxID=2315210 RepID=A0A2R5G5F4_9STRA|nr:Hypothetical Protein FCC1311_024882 [Hondaea fermentalgiana]|eukprot:GBG26267.1 Hypothetical Protein FCC1311_024882 [Hondaea fermentalgiana]
MCWFKGENENIRAVGIREEKIKSLRDTGPTLRLIEQTRSCGSLSTTVQLLKEKTALDEKAAGPVGLDSDHKEFRQQMQRLKQELQLVRGALDEAALDMDTRKLFGQLTLRARYVDVVWASHLQRIEEFCRTLEKAMSQDQSVVAQGYAQRLRVLQLEQEMERRLMQEKMEQQSKDHAYMIQLLRTQKPGSRPQSRTHQDIEGEPSFGRGGCKVETKTDELDAEDDPGAWNNWGRADGSESEGGFRILGTIDGQLRERICEDLSVLELGGRVGAMDRNELMYLVSQLSDVIKQTLVESLLHSASGPTRLGLLKEFLLESEALLDLTAEDNDLLSLLVENMSIEGRMRLLVHLLQVSNPSGFQGESRDQFVTFQNASTRFLMGSGHSTKIAEREEGKSDGSQAGKRSRELPYVSIHLDEGYVNVRGHGTTMDACVGPDADLGGKNLASLEARLRNAFEEGQPDALMANLVIKHPEKYLQVTRGAAYNIKVIVSSCKEHGKGERSHFCAKPHPWTKFLQLSKRKQVRDVSLESILGDVYAAKVLLDQDLRHRGARKPLCNVVMDYFTQKYGLRKLAREYTLGLVKTVRAHAATSIRAETFGIACGVLHEDKYSPIVGDVVTEFIAQLYAGNADTVGRVFSKSEGTVFLPLSAVLSTVSSTFMVAERLESQATVSALALAMPSYAELTSRDAKAGSGSSQKKSKTGKKGSLVGSATPSQRGTVFVSGSQLGGEVKRSWSMPGAVRQQLSSQLESIAAPADAIENLKESGTVLYCDVDRVMEIVVRMFLIKLEVDREMLMHMFTKFDVDGNGVLSLDEFTQLLTECQPLEPLDEHGVIELWNKVNETEDDDDDADHVTKEGFATVFIAQGLQLNYWRIPEIKEKLDEILVARGVQRALGSASASAQGPREENEDLV